jgi:hypothetical protein
MENEFEGSTSVVELKSFKKSKFKLEEYFDLVIDEDLCLENEIY